MERGRVNIYWTEITIADWLLLEGIPSSGKSDLKWEYSADIAKLIWWWWWWWWWWWDSFHADVFLRICWLEWTHQKKQMGDFAAVSLHVGLSVFPKQQQQKRRNLHLSLVGGPPIFTLKIGSLFEAFTQDELQALQASLRIFRLLPFLWRVHYLRELCWDIY